MIDTLIEIATILTLQGAKNDNKNPEKDAVPHQNKRLNVLKYGLSDSEEDHAYMKKA